MSLFDFEFDSPEWMMEGVCNDEDPDIFFPVLSADSAEGKAICATCPSLAACADFAVTNHEPFGIWGGLTHTERKAVRRNPQRLTFFHANLLTAKVPTRRNPPRPRAEREAEVDRTPYAVRIVSLGVSAATIRQWALDNGLNAPVRGTLSSTILDAFEQSRTLAA